MQQLYVTYDNDVIIKRVFRVFDGVRVRVWVLVRVSLKKLLHEQGTLYSRP